MNKEEASFFGSHMETPEVQEQVSKLIKERLYLDYQCFMMLNSVKEELPDEQWREASTLCYARIDKADQIMKLIAGDKKFMRELNL